MPISLLAIGPGGSHGSLSPYLAVPFGLICAAVTAYMIRACWLPIAKRPRWGQFGGGPRMPRVGLFAWAILFIGVGVMIAANILGLQPGILWFRVLMTLVTGVFVAGIHDVWNSKGYRFR